MKTSISLQQILRQWEGGLPPLTADERLAQMYRAHRLRNFIFGVNVQAIDGNSGGTTRFQGLAKGNTPVFARDLVITGITASDCLTYSGNIPFFGAQINVLGSPGVYLEDFLGVGQLLANNFLTDVDPSLAGTAAFLDPNVPILAMEFVPRLFKAGQTLQLIYSMDPFGTFINPLAQSVQPTTVFSSCFALCQGEPYACPSPPILELCKNYVRTQNREYYILDLTIPAADFPSAPVGFAGRGGTRKYRTDPQSRPLLIYGISSNISGAQIQIQDEEKQHNFTAFYPATPGAFIEGDGSLFIGPGLTQPDYLPIWGIAPSTNDMGLASAFKWLPTPHFLAPNTPLTITLENGLRDSEQSMSVNGLTAPGHIAFACTTL